MATLSNQELIQRARDGFDRLRQKTRTFIEEGIRTARIHVSFGELPGRPLEHMVNLVNIITHTGIGTVNEDTSPLRALAVEPKMILLRDVNGVSVSLSTREVEYYLLEVTHLTNTLHNARARLLSIAQESIRIAEDGEVPIEQRQEAADNILTYEEQARERFDYCVELERRATL